MKTLTQLMILSCLTVLAAASEPKKIVFVCEHGSVKSIVAVAHFNRMAEEAGLDYRAISRGTAPNDEVPAVVVDGLKKDGLEPSLRKPVKLAETDTRDAQRIVAMVELPAEYSSDKRVTIWSDVPPVTVDYVKAREVLVQHLTQLVGELKKQ